MKETSAAPVRSDGHSLSSMKLHCGQLTARNLVRIGRTKDETLTVRVLQGHLGRHLLAQVVEDHHLHCDCLAHPDCVGDIGYQVERLRESQLSHVLCYSESI